MNKFNGQFIGNISANDAGEGWFEVSSDGIIRDWHAVGDVPDHLTMIDIENNSNPDGFEYKEVDGSHGFDALIDNE